MVNVMPDEPVMSMIGSPVKDFLKEFLGQIQDGLKEQNLKLCPENESSIKIELNAVEVKEVNGGLKIHIFNAGGKKEDSNSQKITIYAKKHFVWSPETQGGKPI